MTSPSPFYYPDRFVYFMSPRIRGGYAAVEALLFHMNEAYAGCLVGPSKCGKTALTQLMRQYVSRHAFDAWPVGVEPPSDEGLAIYKMKGHLDRNGYLELKRIIQEEAAQLKQFQVIEVTK
jgi:ABC-type glutathione transport system ATPase component